MQASEKLIKSESGIGVVWCIIFTDNVSVTWKDAGGRNWKGGKGKGMREAI